MPFSSSSTEVEPSAGYAPASAGVLVLNGVVFCIKKFEFDRKIDSEDVTTTCGNGKRAFQPTIRSVEFNGEAFLDLAYSPYTAVPDTLAFATVTYSPNGSTVGFSSAKCVIESLKETLQVGSVISWTFSGKAGDDYTVG